MENIRTLQRNYQKKASHPTTFNFNKWDFPKIVQTKTGKDCLIDENGFFWRALTYIPNSYSVDIIANLSQAKEIGHILGLFHHCFGEIDPNTLKDTLPNFHNTPYYLDRYESIVKNTESTTNEDLDECSRFVEKRRKQVNILENAKNQQKIKTRVIHGDPKISNILFDTQTHQAISIIDLDTVKAGLIQYDIGDCLRSSCNPLGEETDALEDVQFDMNIFEAVLSGYLPAVEEILEKNDYLYIFDSVWLMTFELGLRFLTDFLQGDIYFKTVKKEQNLLRAKVQFKLTKSIEEKEKEMKDFINKFRSAIC